MRAMDQSAYVNDLSACSILSLAYQAIYYSFQLAGESCRKHEYAKLLFYHKVSIAIPLKYG